MKVGGKHIQVSIAKGKEGACLCQADDHPAGLPVHLPVDNTTATVNVTCTMSR